VAAKILWIVPPIPCRSMNASAAPGSEVMSVSGTRIPSSLATRSWSALCEARSSAWGGFIHGQSSSAYTPCSASCHSPCANPRASLSAIASRRTNWGRRHHTAVAAETSTTPYAPCVTVARGASGSPKSTDRVAVSGKSARSRTKTSRPQERSRSTTRVAWRSPGWEITTIT